MTSGLWAVVAEFDGPWHAWRVQESHECGGVEGCVMPLTQPVARWRVPQITLWDSTLDAQGYAARVGRIQGLIDQGVIEQMNLCRVLSVPVSQPPPARVVSERLQAVHREPYGGWFDFAAPHGPRTWIVSGSPERAFSVADGRIRLSPIKGTAPTAAALLPKDYEENDLVARALLGELRSVVPRSRISGPAEVQEHPGMVQLATQLEGELPLTPGGPDWAALIAALVPPLSVTGVPREAARTVIERLEPSPRGPYCGVVGWVDVEAGTAEFAAMIRSFWLEGDMLKFGTGAGITRGSDPMGEWRETDLKAATLISALTQAVR